MILIKQLFFYFLTRNMNINLNIYYFSLDLKEFGSISQKKWTEIADFVAHLPNGAWWTVHEKSCAAHRTRHAKDSTNSCISNCHPPQVFSRPQTYLPEPPIELKLMQRLWYQKQGSNQPEFQKWWACLSCSSSAVSLLPYLFKELMKLKTNFIKRNSRSTSFATLPMQDCESNEFPQMLLESLPKIKRLVQSETTNALVRQLTCLLFKGLLIEAK